MGPDDFFASNAAQLQQLARALPGLEAMGTLGFDLPEDDPERVRLTMMSASVGILNAIMQGRWTDTEDRLLADLQRKADRAAGLGMAENETVRFRLLLAMARASRCLRNIPRPEERPSEADLQQAITELESVLAAAGGPRFDRVEPGDPLGTAAAPAGWIAGSLLMELARLRFAEHGGQGGHANEEETKLLARAREHFAGSSLAGLPLSADTVAMMNHLVAQLPGADANSSRTDPDSFGAGADTPGADASPSRPDASPSQPDAGSSVEPDAKVSTPLRPDQLAAYEVNVHRLRELYTQSDGGDRGQAALLLGLAIADLAGHLPDGDPHLPELVREGLLRLAEPDMTEQPAAMATAVRQSRALLDGRLPEAQIGTVERVGAEARTEASAVDAFPIASPDPMLDVDWEKMRHAAEWSRNATDLLRFLAPSMSGDFQSLSQGAVRMHDAIRASGPGSEAVAGEMSVAYLRQLAASAENIGMDSAQIAIIRAMLMVFRVGQCMTAQQAGEPADWPTGAELDELISDLAIGEDPMRGVGPALDGLVGMRGFLLAALILSRIVLDLRDGVGDREPSWYDDTIQRLKRVRDHLATPPPAVANLVRPMSDNSTRLIGDLELARDAAARRRGSSTASGGGRASGRGSRAADGETGEKPAGTRGATDGGPPPPAQPVPPPSSPPPSSPPPSSPPPSSPPPSSPAPSSPVPVPPPPNPGPSTATSAAPPVGPPARQETPQGGATAAPEADRRTGSGSDQDTERVAAALLDEVGGGFVQARAMARKAMASRDPGDIAAAVDALRAVRRGLPAGHLEHATVLTWLARMLGLLAVRSGSPRALTDAIDAAVEAVRAARGSAVRTVAAPLLGFLAGAVVQKHTSGPFSRAEAALRAAQSDADPADLHLAVTLSVGISAARSLQVRASNGDGEALRIVRQTFADVERMLPDEDLTAQWYGPAREVFVWTVAEAISHRDREATEVALRVAGRMEKLLAADPALAERVSGGSGGSDGGGLPDYLGTDEPDELAGLRLTRGVLTMLLDNGPLAEVFYRSAAQRRTDQTERPASPALPAQPGVADPGLLPDEDSRLFADRGLALAAEALGDRQPGARVQRPTGRRGRPRPRPELLRAATADLHAALAGALADSDLRIEVDGVLGRCLAELYWQGVADPSAATSPCAAAAATDGAGDRAAWPGINRAQAMTLLDAVEHINRSLSISPHAEPSVARAHLMDVLARCYQELYERVIRPDAWLDAQRTAEAAVRELARCVLVSDEPAQAMDVAARANETVARAVSWCLADRRYDAAVRIAEAGRSLVLSSVVIARRVEEVLRGAGREELADGWRRGDPQGRLDGLNALWDIQDNGMPLATPSADEIRTALAGTTLDAVVYLIPPVPADAEDVDEDDGAGGHGTGRARPSSALRSRAVVLRPLSPETAIVELPGVDTGPGTPVDRYLAAFGGAVDGFRTATRYPDGFRGSPSGRPWSDALEELGSWAYTHIVRPIVELTRTWSLGRDPHIALIPLGELAAVPYAAAWTHDPAVPGGRRYTVHDLVLTHAASARLLIQTARRGRQDLAKRVVFVVDPAGTSPYAKATAKKLVAHQYPRAEFYGRKDAPSGLATDAVVLGALPRDDQPGASLLHLYTHGQFLAADDPDSDAPTAALQTIDGWLPLTRILDQARNRPPDAVGGLVVTNVCLTDSTRVHFDESVTLATAILAAGATGVVATRWPVDEDTGSVLTYRLHFHLHMGYPAAQALRRAQLDLLAPIPSIRKGLHPHLAALSESRLSHPTSWAGYVYHGI